MNERKGIARACLVLLSALLVAIASCGGLNPLTLRGSGSDAPAASALTAELSALEALEPPPGARADVFEVLKGALRDALQQQGCNKAACIPPAGEANRVADLAIVEDGGVYTLSWHYRNLGDYDQNGAVGISDITPIAMHFGEAVPPGDVDGNSIQAVINGSGNNMVDIADVTAIAMHFGVQCTEYVIQQSATGEEPWEDADSVEVEEGAGDGRLLFSTPFTPSMGSPFIRVVPRDTESNPGVPSELVSIFGDSPAIGAITPQIGVVGAETVFSALVTGAEPVNYMWDFGGGAAPNTSTQPEPTVVLGAEGDYPAMLSVSNGYGGDSRNFTLRVGYPPEATNVTPDLALENTDVVFSASVNPGTGPEPVSYLWEFAEGFGPAASDEVSPVVTVPGEGEYECSLTVSNAFGSHEYPFMVATGSPAEIVTVAIPGPEECNTGENAQFVVEVDGTLPITIAWDFGGGAVPNTSDETQPIVTLGPAGEFTASLAVSNAFGSDLHPFDLNVHGWYVTRPSEDMDIGYTSLAIIDGRPAIAFYASWVANPYYVCATDELGRTWNARVPVETTFLTGNYCSLAEVEGYPAITYYDQGNGDLMYARANDASGETWPTPQMLDSGG